MRPHQPFVADTTITDTISSEEESEGVVTPRNPTNRSSSAVRASVFDAFFELGGMEEDSRIADWIFNDPSESQTADEEVPTGGLTFREQSGSRFRERLDSDSKADEDDEEERRDFRGQTSPSSRTSRFFAKVRPKSRTRRASGAANRNSHASSHSSHDPNRKSFLRFKSRSTANLPATAEAQEVPVPLLPSEFADKSSNPIKLNSPPKPLMKRLPLPRFLSQPTVSRTSSSYTRPFTDDDWEFLSPPATPALNPFLHGTPPPENADKSDVPFPSTPTTTLPDTNADALNRFSLRTFIVPSHSKRLSLLPIRRALSRPEPPNRPPPLRSFSFSAPATPIEHNQYTKSPLNS